MRSQTIQPFITIIIIADLPDLVCTKVNNLDADFGNNQLNLGIQSRVVSAVVKNCSWFISLRFCVIQIEESKNGF